jgi:hypothetical protein
VELRATKKFVRWLTTTEDVEAVRLIAGLRRVLQALPNQPTEPSPALMPLSQAGHGYNLWRVKHHHIPEYAMRLIVWFPDHVEDLAYIVFAGNKHPNHDLWYDRAVKEAEYEVDAIRRNLLSKGTS